MFANWSLSLRRLALGHAASKTSAASRRVAVGVTIGAALLATALPGCGQEQTRVQIRLESGTAGCCNDVRALRLSIRSEDSNTPQTLTYELDPEVQETQSTSVPPGTRFFIKLWGCEQLEGCTPTTSVVEGCTGILQVPEGETRAVQVFLDRRENVLECDTLAFD